MKSSSETNPLSLLNLKQDFTSEVKIIDPQRVSDEASKGGSSTTASDGGGVTSNVEGSERGATPKFFDDSPETPESPKPDSSSAESDDDEPEETKQLLDPNAENFKKVKGIVKEKKKELRELSVKNKELEDKLKTYVPVDVVIEKDNKIQELSKWEKLHNLKASTEYQEKYVQPLNDKHQKLKEIFKDYGVPEESLDGAVKHAVSLTNTAQLNSFLSDHFSDQLGAKEAKDLIGSIKGLEAEAKSAEKEPEAVLQSLREQNEHVNHQREVERRYIITSTARSAWEEEVLGIRQEGIIKELIHVDDDPEFNAIFPDRLLKQAASEYGKIITEMAKDGAKPSKALAKALAKMTLLSQTAGVAIVSRNRAMEQADTLLRNSTRTNGLFRPTIGGGGRSSGGGQDSAPAKGGDTNQELKSDVSNLVNSVLHKR